jgi:hypothetical protein
MAEYSKITGEEKYDDVNWFESAFTSTPVTLKETAKDLKPDEGIRVLFEKHGAKVKDIDETLQKRFDAVIPKEVEKNPFAIQEHIQQADWSDAFLANWSLWYSGQFVDKIDIYSDMGFPDKKPEYDNDGKIWDWTKDPYFKTFIDRGHGQKFVDHRIVNSQHAHYLAEQINRNEKLYDIAGRGHWTAMIAAGFLDPINFIGFGWATKGIYGIRKLDNLLKGKVRKTLGFVTFSSGRTAMKYTGKYLGGGAGVAATVAVLEPLRWELDPLAGPAQSPAIIAGAFLIGGAFNAFLIPGIRSGWRKGKSMWEEGFRKNRIDKQGGEGKMWAEHIIAEHKRHGDDANYESFEYRIGDDLFGITVREEGFTARFLLENGGIIEVKPVKGVGHPLQIPNKNAEYLPVTVLTNPKTKGTQTRIHIKYDDHNIMEMWKDSRWKDSVPEYIHKNIHNKNDLRDYLIKKEVYRKYIHPIEETKMSPKEHKEFIETETANDLIKKSRDDYTTKYGEIPIFSPFIKWLNQWVDIEIGTRMFDKDIPLQNYVAKQILSIIDDNNTPKNSHEAASRMSVLNKKMTIHLQHIRQLMDDVMIDYNQYALGIYDKPFDFRMPFARFNITKANIWFAERFGRLSDKIRQAAQQEPTPREQKLLKSEYEQLIAKLVMTEDVKMSHTIDPAIRNSIQRVRDYLKMYETDITDVGLMASKDNLLRNKLMYDAVIKQITKIIKDDKSSPFLAKAQRSAYKEALEDVTKERNSYGLDKKIDEVKEVNAEKAYELPENYYMRRYLTDQMIEHPKTFRIGILFPFFLAERLNARGLKIDTSNKYPYEFSIEMRNHLYSLSKQERKALIKDALESANDVHTNIIDIHSKYGEIDGGMSGFIFERQVKNNKNKQSPLIYRRIKIASKNFIDKKIMGNPSETVDFISTNLLSDLAVYSDKISTAIEITNIHGDKNGRGTVWDMKLKILAKVINEKDVTVMNKTVSTFENSVNKLYGTHSPTDPKNPITRIGNILKDIIVPAKLSAVTLTSQPDWANLILVHGWNNVFDAISLNKNLKRLLSKEDIKVLQKEEAYMLPLMEEMANLSPYQRQIAYDTLPIGSQSKMGVNVKEKLINKTEQIVGGAEHALQNFNTFYFQSVFLPQFTGYVKKFAGMISTHRFIEDLIKAGAGKLSKKGRNRLRDYGFEDKDIKMFMRIFKAGLIDVRKTRIDSSWQAVLSGNRYKEAVAYVPNIMKWTNSGILGADSFTLLFRQAVKADAERTILTPSPTDNMNLAYGGIHAYSRGAQRIIGHPQFKDALTATTTALGFAMGDVTGAATGLALGIGTTITKGQNQVMIGNVALKLFFMFQGWTRKAMRVRGTNAVAGTEESYVHGTIAAVTIGAFMNYIKDPYGTRKLIENEEYQEFWYRGALHSGAFNVPMDILNAIDMGTRYEYGGRGFLGLKPPYGVPDDSDYIRNFGALPNIINEGYNVYHHGTNREQADYITKQLPYNNAPYIGSMLYKPYSANQGSWFGEAVREHIIEPIAD